VSGFLRASYASSSDAALAVGGDDLGGFSIDDAQIWVNGTVGDFSVVVQAEASNSLNTPGETGAAGALNLLDAYTSWKATEQLKVQLGQFRPAFLGSSLRNENNLLFINRSFLGARYAFRDEGVQLSGAFGMINFAVYAQNGTDDTAKEMATASASRRPRWAPPRTTKACSAPPTTPA
jgi:hypothetical protein